MNQQRFTGLQIGPHEDVAPYREERLGQRGGFDIAQRTGHRQALAYRRYAQLGITTASNQRANAITDFEAGRSHSSCVTGHDFTGDFQARNIRSSRRHRIVAGSLQHIGAIDAAGLDPDQNFARSGLRVWTLAQPQHVGRAIRSYFNGFHWCLSLI